MGTKKIPVGPRRRSRAAGAQAGGTQRGAGTRRGTCLHAGAQPIARIRGSAPTSTPPADSPKTACAGRRSTRMAGLASSGRPIFFASQPTVYQHYGNKDDVFLKKNLAISEESSTFAPDFRGQKSSFPRRAARFRREKKFGVWRSWLAHLHGVQGVESSSLFTPTFFCPFPAGLSWLSIVQSSPARLRRREILLIL